MSYGEKHNEDWRNSNNQNSCDCYLDWFEKAEIKVFKTLKKVTEHNSAKEKAAAAG